MTNHNLGQHDAENSCCDGCSKAALSNCGGQTKPIAKGIAQHFERMIDHCLEYAQAAKNAGQPIVGIMCEFTPRELLLAANAVPVCLCGGDMAMIAPAEEILPANLCPLIKSTFGYHITKSNPFLEMADLVVAETTCDGKKKMYELMAQSRDMFVLELPQKSGDADAFAHWRSQLERLKDFLEHRYNIAITPDRLRRVIAKTNRYRQLRRELAELMSVDAPPMTGRELLDAKSIIWCMDTDVAMYEKQLPILRKSAGPKDRRNKIRVLLTGVPVVHGAEKVVNSIESSGGLVVCMENCTGLKPILEDVSESAADPMQAIAEKYFHLPCSVMTSNNARLESLQKLVKQYRPQCVVDLAWQACLTYDIESASVKRFVEQELHLPYLRISTDYSPNDSARIRLRLEAMFEMVAAQTGRAGLAQ